MLKAAKPAETNEIAIRAAQNLRGILAEERWSGRKAALALGLTPMYVNRRLSGEAELSVSDVEMFARLLKIDSSTLYSALMKPSTLDSAELAVVVGKKRTSDYKGHVSEFNKEREKRRLASVTHPRNRVGGTSPKKRAA